MVMPGVTTRNVSEKRASCVLASLFSACQAISIAMTTVLPAPVAILQRHPRKSPGLSASLASRSSFSIQLSPYFLRHFGDIDGGFQCLDLAEEELFFPLGVGPVLQK